MIPFYKYKPTSNTTRYNSDLSSWMGDNLYLLQNTKLRDLIIPGSHNSGTYCINTKKLGSSLTKNQNISIYTQLKSGIRYQDLRYGSKTEITDDIWMNHGPHLGVKWSDGQEEVSKFIEENPQEILVIKMQYEASDLTPEQKVWVYNSIALFLDSDKIIKFDDIYTWFDVKTVTVGEIVSRKKNYIIYQDDRLFDQTISEKLKKLKKPGKYYESIEKTRIEKNEYFLWQTNLFDPYYCLTSPTELADALKEDLQKSTSSEYKSSKLHVCQICLSGDLNFCYGCKFQWGCTSGVKSYLTGKLLKNNFTSYFQRDNIDLKLNIVLLDFIDWFFDIIRFLIGSNFKQNLKIHSAFDKNGPIPTEKQTTQITRNNCLFLPNVYNDLELSKKSGYIYIGYSYNDQPLKLEAFKVDKNHPLLITYQEVSSDEKFEKTKNISSYVGGNAVGIFVNEIDFTNRVVSILESRQKISGVCDLLESYKKKDTSIVVIKKVDHASGMEQFVMEVADIEKFDLQQISNL